MRTTSVGQDTRASFTETSVVAHDLWSASAVADRAEPAACLGAPPARGTKSHAAYEMARV